MFCKFCGSKIALNENKCLICGAAINRQDGGQTFYDESELDTWKTEIIADGAPKTEMREPLPVSQRPVAKSKKKSAPVIPPLSAPVAESYKAAAPQAASSRPKTNTSAKKRKKKKDTGANKLIIFCISVVIAIVLLVVALIAAFSGGKPKSEPQGCPICGDDHLTHPADKHCEVCDSPLHYTAEHPTCPQCGSTTHTTHPNTSQPKPEQTKPEQPKQEQPKQEQPKQEQPKQEQPKQEQPKQEQPKQEEPKQETAPAPTPCQTCGSTEHAVHPTCPVCGSTRHTVHENVDDSPTI